MLFFIFCVVNSLFYFTFLNDAYICILGFWGFGVLGRIEGFCSEKFEGTEAAFCWAMVA